MKRRVNHIRDARQTNFKYYLMGLLEGSPGVVTISRSWYQQEFKVSRYTMYRDFEDLGLDYRPRVVISK